MRRTKLILLLGTGLLGTAYSISDDEASKPSNCTYTRDLSQAYPYPYIHSEWFKYLQLGKVRAGPKAEPCVASLDADKVTIRFSVLRSPSEDKFVV
jgi:hypothetical protein